jgi:tetratricopeptide (TPR) repeat protein
MSAWQRLLFLCLSVGLTASETASAGPQQTTARSAPPAAQVARPGNAQAATELGLKLYRQRRESLEAQRLLDQASVRFPKRHDVHLALLDSYLVRGNAKKATALLQRLEPELASDVRFAFDAIYYLLQYRQAALAQEQWRRVHGQIQARTQQGSGPAAQRNLGEDLFVQGLLAAAAQQKDEAMRLLHLADSHGFPALDSRQILMLADTLYELQEDGLAVPTYQEYLQHWPEDKQARLHLAVSLQACNQPLAAQEQLEHVLRQDPRFPEANYYLGTVLFDQKRKDEAKARLDQELKLNPRCHPCMAKLAHVAYLAGDDQSCESWLRRAAALDPAWAETNLVYGMLEIRAGKHESAIEHLSKVVEQFPDHTQAHFQLAIAYQRGGNAEKALEHANVFKKLSQEQKAQTVGQPR